ncbi:MAG: hypothetical protein PUJ57_00080 [Peptoniphilaceae bacterium]|nr:hypothetical protein [Peptoniphilaceae bacterium]MDY6085131.1 hypothetical protein [Peptoniphilaceae bacterium]
MNETIQAILDIDRSTKELEEQTEKTLAQELQHTRDCMNQMQRESSEMMRREAEAEMRAIEENRMAEEEALKSTLNEQIATIWRFFDAHREEMAEEWFNRLRAEDGIL